MINSFRNHQEEIDHHRSALNAEKDTKHMTKIIMDGNEHMPREFTPDELKRGETTPVLKSEIDEPTYEEIERESARNKIRSSPRSPVYVPPASVENEGMPPPSSSFVTDQTKLNACELFVALSEYQAAIASYITGKTDAVICQEEIACAHELLGTARRKFMRSI